jgi:hypothetical protein
MVKITVLYSLFLSPSNRRVACHPERSAPQARDAKDLLVVKRLQEQVLRYARYRALRSG